MRRESVDRTNTFTPTTEKKSRGDIPALIPSYEEAKKQARDYYNKICGDQESLSLQADKMNPWFEKAIRELIGLKRMNLFTTFGDTLLSPGKHNIKNRFLKKVYKQAADDSVLYFQLRDNGKNVKIDELNQPLAYLRNEAHLYLENINLKKTIQLHPEEFVLRFLTTLGLSDYAEVFFQKGEHAIDIIPEIILKEGGLGKLIWTMAGVIMYKLEKLQSLDKSPECITELLDAIEAGYNFGLTYPLVDDVLDSSHVLNDDEKTQYSSLVYSALQRGFINEKDVPGHPIALELKKAFDVLTELYPFEKNRDLYRALTNLHLAQIEEADRDFNKTYSDQDIYAPVIIKAAYTRIVTALMAGLDVTSEFVSKMMMAGLPTQLIDDFRDYPSDIKTGHFTPFTYYAHAHKRQTGFTNPMLLYLASLNKIIGSHNNDQQVGRLLSRRFTQAVKQFSIYNGTENIKGFYDVFLPENPYIRKSITKIARYKESILDVEGGLISCMIDYSIERKKTKSGLSDHFVRTKKLVEENLEIAHQSIEQDNKLVQSMNYSLMAGGKRWRPALGLMIADMYKIQEQKILPFILAIESAHTASLIFDDLPAQDDAKSRRDKLPNHLVFEEYTSQLSGISLIARAFEQLSILDFEPDNVNRVIRYCSELLGHNGLSLGQQLDLEAAQSNKPADLKEITKIFKHKTALAVEMSSVPVAILGDASEQEIAALKEYSYHLGLAFQVLDDFQDYGEGQVNNNDVQVNLNIISCIGETKARTMFFEAIANAKSSLEKINRNTELLLELVNHFASKMQ